MPAFSAQAVVLRRADYRDNDRMLTLLSPAHGRMEAIARGCKRPASPLLAASEMFALGEYEFYAGKGRLSVTACLLTDTFYPLREDFTRLAHATYIANVSEAAAQPNMPAEKPFLLLIKALAYLAYGEMPPRVVTAAFLVRFVSAIGYKPQIDHCRLCGKEIKTDSFLDCEEGGVVCSACADSAQKGIPLSADEMEWMREASRAKVIDLRRPPENAPLRQLMHYAELKIDRNIPSGRTLR